MSNLVRGLVTTSTMRDPTELAVLQCLADHGNDYGESCFVGIPRIAREIRRSERTVTRTLDDLEAAGWFTRMLGDGRGHMTQYTLAIDKLKGCQDDTLQPKSKPQLKRVTLAQQRVTLATVKGDIDAAPIGRTVFNPKSKEVPTPLPPALRGECADKKPAHEGNGKGPLIEAAVEQVMQGCGFTAVRLRRKICAVVRQRVDLGEALGDIARRMVERWQSYSGQGTRLRAHVNAGKFFEEGLWLDSGSWHWDNENLREENLRAQAGAGTWSGPD